MKKIITLPVISGSSFRPPIRINNLEELKSLKTSYSTYGMYEGDIIVFPQDLGSATVFIQPVRENRNEMQTLILVLKNGKESYISIGTLCKQTVEGTFTCPFTKNVGELPNDYERLVYLCGKTIKDVRTKKIKVYARDRISGEVMKGIIIEQTVPVIEDESLKSISSGEVLAMLSIQDFGVCDYNGIDHVLSGYKISDSDGLIKTNSFSFSYFKYWNQPHLLSSITVEGRYTNPPGPFNKSLHSSIILRTNRLNYHLSFSDDNSKSVIISDLEHFMEDQISDLFHFIECTPILHPKKRDCEESSYLYEKREGHSRYSVTISDQLSYEISGHSRGGYWEY